MTGSEPVANDGGPLLKLIAAALQLWIRSQCEAAESLDLRLQGTALQLLSGQVMGLTLMARRVVYQDLQIEQVQLTSGALRVKVGALLRGQPFQLEHPFRVRGQVAFTAAGLTGSLVRPRWQGLADTLGEEVLGLTPLQELRIVGDGLIFAAQAAGESRLMELETRPQAIDGSLGFLSTDGDLMVRLPMDGSIHITTANLEGGMLQLQGEAVVTP
jgi:hypothetical protein